MYFYSILFRKTYLRLFQFRLANLINNLGGLIFGFMYIAIWQGTLGSGQQVSGMDRIGMGHYIAFTQCLLFITTFLPRGCNMEEGVRTGSISHDMVRPYNFFVYHLVQTAGVQIYNICFRSIPIYVVFMLVFWIPAHLLNVLPLLLPSLLMSAYLGFLLNYFVGLAAFWTNSTHWAFILQRTLILTFSGNFVPSSTMPGVLSVISMYSPFAGLHYYPAMVYLRKASLDAFLVPMLWCLVLTAVALWLTHLARRKMEIQGG